MQRLQNTTTQTILSILFLLLFMTSIYKHQHYNPCQHPNYPSQFPYSPTETKFITHPQIPNQTPQSNPSPRTSSPWPLLQLRWKIHTRSQVFYWPISPIIGGWWEWITRSIGSTNRTRPSGLASSNGTNWHLLPDFSSSCHQPILPPNT